MSVKNIVKAQPISTVNAANLLANAYLAMNAGFPDAIFMIRILNASNTNVFVSYDAINDNDFVPSGNGILELNFQSNAQPNNFVTLLSKGTRVYLRATAGVGSIFLAAYYQPQQ